uniref:Design protein n8 n=1 Tax=synthetic construct TaxID=32630 RepID=UPI0039FDE17B
MSGEEERFRAYYERYFAALAARDYETLLEILREFGVAKLVLNGREFASPEEAVQWARDTGLRFLRLIRERYEDGVYTVEDIVSRDDGRYYRHTSTLRRQPDGSYVQYSQLELLGSG